jgi:hypothetical protein
MRRDPERTAGAAVTPDCELRATLNSHRIGTGHESPVPGDTVAVSTAAGDFVGVVEIVETILGVVHWTIATDDGWSVITRDRSQVKLLTARQLPIVRVNNAWKLDVAACRRMQEAGAL